MENRQYDHKKQVDVTNFFSCIQELKLTGTLTIVIKTLENEKMIVSVLLTERGTEKRNMPPLPPLVLNGSTETMDSQFFNSIKAPPTRTNELLINKDSYLKNLQVSGNSQAKEKSKKSKEIHDNSGPVDVIEDNTDQENKTEFKAKMEIVHELEKQMKYAEAVGALPQIMDFPSQEEKITKKKTELQLKSRLLTLL